MRACCCRCCCRCWAPRWLAQHTHTKAWVSREPQHAQRSSPPHPTLCSSPHPTLNFHRVALEKRAGEFNIILEDVSITHLMFSKEFTTAIESKQVAQQDAERSKFVVQKAEQEKLAAIILAEGEGEAAQLISEALKTAGNGAIEVKRIDAALEIATTLSKSRNVLYIPGGGNMMMAMPAPGQGRRADQLS